MNLAQSRGPVAAEPKVHFSRLAAVAAASDRGCVETEIQAQVELGRLRRVASFVGKAASSILVR